MQKDSETFPLEHAAYSRAMRRCRNPNSDTYAHYGGRGIEFRFESFVEFLEHIGPKPSSEHTLDRIDPNGHYERDNVRWATWTQQQRNRRNNRRITFQGLTKCLAEWAEIMELNCNTLKTRLDRGWTVKEALCTPVGESP